MKSKKFALSLLLTILFMAVVSGQEDGSEIFNALRDAVRPSLPEGFIVNTGQTSDSRFSYRITYDENGEETNRLIFTFNPNGKEFTEMEIATGGQPFTWEGRKALYIDGSKTAMSGVSVILINGTGKLDIEHREFITFKPLDKEALEKMLSKISLDLIENPQ